MVNECIASQVHIPPFDVQGSLTQEQKVCAVELGLQYLRYKNPNAYIAFSGHGLRPSSVALDLCDYVNWEELHPINGGGTVIGSPAQYHSVYKAVEHCSSKGFKKILKVRGDGLYGITNFFSHCDDILTKERKKMLVTQMTANVDNKMGDCIMFGEADLMCYLWNDTRPQHHGDGLIHIGTNFRNFFSDDLSLSWNDLVKKHCAFRNLCVLEWMDLRWNYHALEQYGWEKFKNELFEGTFPLADFYWGKNNGWHTFDDNNNMTYSIERYYYEEKTFYNNK